MVRVTPIGKDDLKAYALCLLETRLSIIIVQLFPFSSGFVSALTGIATLLTLSACWQVKYFIGQQWKIAFWPHWVDLPNTQKVSKVKMKKRAIQRRKGGGLFFVTLKRQ